MLASPESASNPGDAPPDPRWELALRVTAAPRFLKASRLKELLLHLCEQTLRGNAHSLSEQQIGCSLFGRKADYNTADDSIVRVHVRQLRMRLEQHFQEEGVHEALVIEIPKGSYVPVFRPRDAEQEGAKPTLPPDPDDVTSPWRIRLPWLIAAALALACALLTIRAVRPNLPQTPVQSARAAPPWLLAAAFDPERVTTVVLPDSGFGLVQGWLDRKLTLDDYLQPGFPASLPGLTAEQVRMVNSFAGRPYITFSSAIVTSRLAALAGQHGWRFSLRHARDIKARDLSEGNHILLGSPMSNPWVSLLEKDLNFETGWDPKTKVPLFRNRSPRQGERNTYVAGGPNGTPGEAYALIALLLNRPSPSGAPSRVLVIEGVNMEATEAAWDFAASTPQKALIEDRGVSGPVEGKPYQFEALLHTRTLVGAASGTSVLAVRTAVPSPSPLTRR